MNPARMWLIRRSLDSEPETDPIEAGGHEQDQHSAKCRAANGGGKTRSQMAISITQAEHVQEAGQDYQFRVREVEPQYLWGKYPIDKPCQFVLNGKLASTRLRLAWFSAKGPGAVFQHWKLCDRPEHLPYGGQWSDYHCEWQHPCVGFRRRRRC